MKKQSLAILIFLAVSLSSCGLVDKVLKRDSSNHEGHDMSSMKEEKAMYQCSMHPGYTSDKPGVCIICGMRLTKSGAEENHSSQKPEGSVYINSNKQQIIGIKTQEAVSIPVSKSIKILGTVTPDERRIFHVHTKFSGYIEKVFADYEGKYVSLGDPLFTIYSPDLLSTQEEYLLAIKAEEQLAGHKYDSVDKSQQHLKEASLRRLELWDISEKDIDELARSKEVRRTLTFYSPASGFINKKTVFEGLSVSPDMDLYQITDLSRVWVIGEVFEQDLPFVKIGQNARIDFPHGSTASFTGKITYVYPELDAMNRTGKVRIEVANPDLSLKPNSYVNANITQGLGKQLIVPQSSVIDTGERKIVFVKTEDNYFIPKDVETGAEVNLKDGNYLVIKSGITEGEDIVSDGTFLVDSESNLQYALKQFSGGHNH